MSSTANATDFDDALLATFGGNKKNQRKPVGVGKVGKGKGKGGKVRRVLKAANPDGIMANITKPGIRRLARRAGIKRIGKDSMGSPYDKVRDVMSDFLDRVLADVATYAQHAMRSTATAMDVVYALKANGQTLYGYGG